MGTGQQDPSQRRADRQEATEHGEETEPAAEEEEVEEWDRDGETLRVAAVEAIPVGGGLDPP